MKKRNTKQVILPLITSFIWGSSFVAQSLGAGKVGGFTFTAARSIPAVLVLGALVLILRRVRHEGKYTPQQKKDLLEGGLVCGIFLTLGTNLQQFGIADTTAGKAGFITALYIVLVPLAGMFLGKKANKRLFLCVLIAVVGLYFLCFTGSEGAMSFGRGDFLVFLCAFAFTGHILCVDHYVQKVDGIALSCVQFAVMMVLSTVCAFTFETVDFAALGECTFYILYIGILSSAGGYTLQIRAEGRRPDGRLAAAEPGVLLRRGLRGYHPARAHERTGVPRLRADAHGGAPLAAAGEDSRRSGAAEKIR